MTQPPLIEAEVRLVNGMVQAARGPQRNGFYALWLIVRACEGLLPPDALPERAHLQRLRKLERRLSSLSLPAPLRRAVNGSITDLQTADAKTSAVVLQQLVAPATDTLGTVATGALTAAARVARKTFREVEPA